MRKFLVLLFAMMLVSSLPAYSYGIQTYESGAWGDSAIGWAQTRDFNNYNDIQINTLNPLNGSQSVMLPLVDTLPFGQLHFYLLYCKSESWSNGICTDSVWQHDQFGFNSGVLYNVYIPAGAPIDSILAFNRDSDWRWCMVNNYQAGDLTFGAWNQLIAPVRDTNGAGDPIRLPIIQFDLWIYTDSMLTNPSCTLYMDDVTTDDTLVLGIGDEVAASELILGTCVNSIKFSVTDAQPVVVQLFRIDGSKVAETAFRADAGSNEVSVGDIAAGVYLVKIIGPTVSGVSKLLKL